MNLKLRVLPFSRLMAALACVAGVVQTTPAHAALANPVSVSLIAPLGIDGATPISVTDASVDPAVGIAAGDGRAIDAAGWMLSGEFVRFGTNFINIHVAAGGTNSAGGLITGFLGDGADHARYQFDNLSVAGFDIVGIVAQLVGGTGLDAATPMPYAHFVDADTVTLDLDGLIFTPDTTGGQSDAFAEFRIDLRLTPTTNGNVPEPASAALLMAGVLALRLARRSTASA